MSRIPSRSWAASIGLCDSPLCRHCASDLEDEAHLLFNCPSLNYSSFIPYNFNSLQDLGNSLNSLDSFELENALLRFIKFNDLFQVDNVDTPINAIPSMPMTAKRKLEISPSPLRKKRRRTTSNNLASLKRKNTSQNGEKPPKRQLLGSLFKPLQES